MAKRTEIQTHQELGLLPAEKETHQLKKTGTKLLILKTKKGKEGEGRGERREGRDKKEKIILFFLKANEDQEAMYKVTPLLQIRMRKFSAISFRG